MSKLARKQVVEEAPAPETFEQIKDQAVVALTDLRRLSGMKKMSASAFVALAMRHANMTEDRLQEVRKLVGEAGGDLASTVRRWSQEYGQRPGWPCPVGPDKVHKMMRITGTDLAQAIATDLKITALEISAVAAVIATERWAHSFGEIEDWNFHHERMMELDGQLRDLYAKMRVTWTPAHVKEGALTPVDRAAGLVRLSFKGFEDLNPGMNDWEQIMVRRIVERLEHQERIAQASQEAVAAELASIAAVQAEEARRAQDND